MQPASDGRLLEQLTMIRFTCPTCKSVLQSPGITAGNKVACPKCGQRLLVPSPVKPAASNKTVLGSLLPDSEPVVGSSSSITPAAAAATSSGLRGETGAVVGTPSISYSLSKGRRYLSFPWLLAVFIFGFLPWCEVGCNGGNLNLAIRVTQSGYQALYGDYTTPWPSMVEDELYKEARKRIEDVMRKGMSKGEKEQARKILQEHESYLAIVSPYLIAFWSGVLVMAGLVWFVPLGRLRLFVSSILCVTLLVTLSIHAAVGMPLERRIEIALVQELRDRPLNAGNTAMMAAFTKIDKTQWFWLTMCAVVALITTEALVNWLMAERWLSQPRDVILILFMTILGIALAALGCFGQHAAYKHQIGWMEDLVAKYATEEGAPIAVRPVEPKALPPSPGPPGRQSFVGHGAQRQVNQQLLRNIGQYYVLYRTEKGREPQNLQEFKDYLKNDRDARGAKMPQALEKGGIVMVFNTDSSESQVLAYEKEAFEEFQNRLVLFRGGALKLMTEPEFQAALKAR